MKYPGEDLAMEAPLEIYKNGGSLGSTGFTHNRNVSEASVKNCQAVLGGRWVVVLEIKVDVGSRCFKDGRYWITL